MDKDQRQAKRENEILTAAHDLFLEKGLPNVTIEMIASRCNLGKGTVYNYFKSKEEIYAKLYLLHYQTLMQTIVDVEKDHDHVPVVPRLRRHMELFADFHMEDRKRHMVLRQCQDSIDMGNLPEGTRKDLLAVNAQTYELADNLFKTGMQEEVFRQANTRWLTRIGIAMHFGVIRNLIEFPGDMTDEEQLDYLKLTREVILKGMRRD